MAEVNALPEGTRLVHIGFFKSGTTSLQESFQDARERIQPLGVVYPGRLRHHGKPALAVTERVLGWADRGGVRTDRHVWDDFVAEVADAGDRRVMISAERFSEADPEAIRTVVESLGPQRVHVVATVRPFGKILPSSWQQFIKNGARAGYEEWLGKMLADPPDPNTTPAFWLRHDHPRVLQRWLDVVGPGNVTLVVLDSDDRTRIFRVFEQLLALPVGSLVESSVRDDNRSMTAAEADLVWRVGTAARDQVDWPEFNRAVRIGLVKRLVTARQPGPTEERIATPSWAVERAAEIGSRFATEIAAMDVNVVGELSALGDVSGVPVASDNGSGEPLMIPVDAAVEAALGILSGTLGRGPNFEPFENRRLRRRLRRSRRAGAVAAPESSIRDRARAALSRARGNRRS